MVDLVKQLAHYRYVLPQVSSVTLEGKLIRVVGLTLEAVGCRGAVGSRYQILVDGGKIIEAEVIGFSDDRTFLMPITNPQGLAPGLRIRAIQSESVVQVGDALLGRVIDGSGNPLDDLGPILTENTMPLIAEPVNPLARSPISKPLDVGIQSVNALLTMGCGQRIGLFAGSGVGKSVLLGMMTRFTSADVVVVGLIGERGREVKEFIENSLGAEGMARAVVVATPADYSPLLRLHGAMRATAIAEHFRNQGKHVLLLMDSLTRFAQAQREIGLAVGEPPTTKGYPPSVFSKLPALVERAGNNADGSGSITALYTVLMEGDDTQDPITDSARAILDGHIMLSRQLAEEGQYPAVDVEASISRVMSAVIDPAHQQAAFELKRLLSLYEQNKDLISVGAYAKGHNPELDRAVERIQTIKNFLAQSVDQQITFEESVKALKQAIS